MDKLNPFDGMSTQNILQMLKDSQPNNRKDIFQQLTKEQVSKIDFKDLLATMAPMIVIN